jgi:hypothetical protein
MQMVSRPFRMKNVKNKVRHIQIKKKSQNNLKTEMNVITFDAAASCIAGGASTKIDADGVSTLQDEKCQK